MPFAIAYFTKAIQNSYRASYSRDTNYLVVTVPSHDPNYINGITKVAKRLCAIDKRFIDGTNAVKRIALADSFCKTNNRSSQTLIDTIALNQNLIKNQNILLLDDISSTGTSLLTIEKMLLQAGAASVTPLAMAQTVAY